MTRSILICHKHASTTEQTKHIYMRHVKHGFVQVNVDCTSIVDHQGWPAGVTTDGVINQIMHSPAVDYGSICLNMYRRMTRIAVN